MVDSTTAKLKNKRIRQENLRDQLSAQGHVQHVVDILTKLSNVKLQIDREQVNRYKIVLDGKFKLIDKYLPTEKPTTISGDGEDGEVILKWLG